jgi:hypothetical protein
MTIRLFLFLLLLLFAIVPGHDAAGERFGNFRESRIRGHMTLLADDLLEDRGTSTRGFEIAAKYGRGV